MQENKQHPDAEEILKDLPLTAEEIGFRADEMIACEKCARANAPNRLKCMYCGAPFAVSPARAAGLKPGLRKLENWEPGFNLVYLPNDELPLPAASVAEIAAGVGIEKETLEKIFETRRPLPLRRCESSQEADILRERLAGWGLKTLIVSDAALAADSAPKRLRGLEMRGDFVFLTLFNTNETCAASRDDLTVIVTGAIFEKTVESTEARKKGEIKILEATETASDEAVIDIYAKDEPAGFRILTKGFDFSCLGAEKGILARENIKKLAARLQAFAPRAKLVDDYPAVRSLLGPVWEIEERRDSQGLARQRFGKFDLSSVSSSSNSRQFTKYSRLQQHLL